MVRNPATTSSSLIVIAVTAGLNAAMAGDSDEANAQAVRLDEITLNSNTGEILLALKDKPAEVQANILRQVTDCIEARDKSRRDECIAGGVTAMTERNLEAVKRENYEGLELLGEVIGLTVEDLIREPVFCHYAPNDAAIENCTKLAEAVILADLDVQIAQSIERRIATETREAQLDVDIKEAETRLAAKEVYLKEAETRNAELDSANAKLASELKEVEKELAAYKAVLKALRQVATEEDQKN